MFRSVFSGVIGIVLAFSPSASAQSADEDWKDSS